MKKCPSCNAQCEDSVELCPVCGYSFVDGDVGDKQGQPKKTMMGFPSLSALPDDEEEPEQQDPVKQTLFGFPANEEEQEDAGLGEEESDEDEYAATHIIPASEFSFADEDAGEDSDADLRGTIAGRPARESQQDDNTEIVPGTALFPGREVDPQLEQQSEQRPAEEPNRGTLLGMSLDEVEALSGESSDGPAAGPRSTQFAIPAAQRGESGNAEDETQKQTISDSDLGSASSEDEEEFDDAPTQAWDPGSLNLKEKFDPKGRKKLLEKIRKSRPSNRDTSKGIPGVKGPESRDDGGQPDLSALKKLRPKRELVPTPQEFPEDERETQEHEKAGKPSGTPASGVVRPPKRASEPAHDTEENKSAPGGASAYMLGPGQTQRDGPKKGVPIGQLRSNNPQPPQPKGLGDGLSDPEFATAETDIASGDLLEQAGVDPDPMPVEEVSGFDETLAGGGLNVTDQALANAADQSGDRAPSGPPSQPRSPQSGQGQHQLRPGQDQQRPHPQQGPQQPGPQPRQQGQQQQAQQQQAQQQQAQQQLRPQMASDRFTPSQRTQQPNVYETFDGGPSSAPQGQAPVPRDSTQGMKQSSRPGEDPLVRTIQSLFGVIAGAITLIVQVVVLLDGFPESPLATVVVALALTMGLAAIVSSLAPISMQMRSLALFGIGALIGVTFILGFVVTIPSTFLVVALGAFVAVMAAAFPIIARHLL